MGHVKGLQNKDDLSLRGPHLITEEMQKYGAWGPFHELGHNHQWNK